MAFDIKSNQELKVLLQKFVKISPEEYMQLYGNGALEMLKTKPMPKDEDLIISDRDKLLGTILHGMEDIEIDLSNDDHINSMNFNLKNIAYEDMENNEIEPPISSTWYKDYEEEFKFHISTNIKIISGYENSTSYWLQCRIGTLQPFLIQLPRIYKIEETHSAYNAFLTTSKSKVQYIHQYYYVGNDQFLSFYQIFWDLVRSKEKIIRKKVERNTETLLLNVIDECLREAMKICCTYIGVDLSNYSLWLMTRQFKIEELNDGKGNTEYRKISPEWADIVTGSFGNVGSKFSLKHGVNIELVNGWFKPVDHNIVKFPYATERLTNIFPSKAGFKRINVTDIEKHPLLTYRNADGEFTSPYQNNVPVYISEVDYSKIPKTEEINLTCIVIDIKDDIGSLRNNTLDMFNFYDENMHKLKTVDDEEITHGNKLILPMREKAVIGGTYGDESTTQVLCSIRLNKTIQQNVLNHFKSQNIPYEISEDDSELVYFIPDLIMNHTNRDNNVALRLLSNIRFESISENKTINISLDESNKTILKEKDELIVTVYISIGDKLIEKLDTQLLFLHGYHQPTHSAKNTATYGQVNTNYRQALAASQVFTRRDFNHTIKHFDKALYKAKISCGGYEIVTVDSATIRKNQEYSMGKASVRDAFKGL